MFSYEINEVNEMLFLKNSLFEIVKELSKSNQNWCASSTIYAEVKNENSLARACLGKSKNFVF